MKKGFIYARPICESNEEAEEAVSKRFMLAHQAYFILSFPIESGILTLLQSALRLASPSNPLFPPAQE